MVVLLLPGQGRYLTLRPEVDGPWGCRLRFWVWRWEVLRVELELRVELVVYSSEMP